MESQDVIAPANIVNNNMLFAFSCMVVRIRFIVFTFYAFKERMFCLNVILSSFGV